MGQEIKKNHKIPAFKLGLIHQCNKVMHIMMCNQNIFSFKLKMIYFDCEKDKRKRNLIHAALEAQYLALISCFYFNLNSDNTHHILIVSPIHGCHENQQVQKQCRFSVLKFKSNL